jgi:hypothetical protein
MDQHLSATLAIKVVILPNIWRDVITFWHSIKEISACSDVFLKLPWKDSSHIDSYHPQEAGKSSGDVSRKNIFTALIPSSRPELKKILSLFAKYMLHLPKIVAPCLRYSLAFH